MRISISDIRAAADFAKRLERACDGILNGETRTKALDREDISLSVFLTLIKGLKKSGDESAKKIEELRRPAWQDELVRNMTGEEYFFLPDDFEAALKDVMERVLDDDERRAIQLLYPEKNTFEQAAGRMGISVNTVRARQKSALKLLKEHADEFVVGKKFLKKLDLVKAKQDEYEQALDWLDEAIDYLDELGEDENESIADQPISDAALAFYSRSGLVTLADVVEHTLPEIFTEISDGHYLAAVRSGDFDMDSKLDERIGLDAKTANAFASAGIRTVREFLALPENEAFSIKGVGPKTVVYIYRRVLFG